MLMGVQCQVCGIGSLFVAAIDRVNQCTPSDMRRDLNNSHFMRKYLKEWFDGDQLRMIEAAFEGADININGWHPSEPVRRAIKFTDLIKTPEGRLKKIMRNIIANHGEFLP